MGIVSSTSVFGHPLLPISPSLDKFEATIFVRHLTGTVLMFFTIPFRFDEVSITQQRYNEQQQWTQRFRCRSKMIGHCHTHSLMAIECMVKLKNVKWICIQRSDLHRIQTVTTNQVIQSSMTSFQSFSSYGTKKKFEDVLVRWVQCDAKRFTSGVHRHQMVQFRIILRLPRDTNSPKVFHNNSRWRYRQEIGLE